MTVNQFKVGEVYCTKNFGSMMNFMLYIELYKEALPKRKERIAYDLRGNAVVIDSSGTKQTIDVYARKQYTFPVLEYRMQRDEAYAKLFGTFTNKQTPAMFLGYENIPFRSSYIVDINDGPGVDAMKLSGHKFFLAESTFNERFAGTNIGYGYKQSQVKTQKFYVVDHNIKYPMFLINGLKCVVLDGSKSNFEKIDVSTSRPVSTTLSFEITLKSKPGLLAKEREKKIASTTKQLSQMKSLKKYGYNASFKDAKNEFEQSYEAFDYTI